jgi:hypothetical protein
LSLQRYEIMEIRSCCQWIPWDPINYLERLDVGVDGPVVRIWGKRTDMIRTSLGNGMALHGPGRRPALV